MSAAKTPMFIYPFFDGEGVQVDLYESENAPEPMGSADYPLVFLAEEYIAEFADANGFITDIDAAEGAYALIDALREAANRLAEALDKEEDADE